jgi:hypothetical protein
MAAVRRLFSYPVLPFILLVAIMSGCSKSPRSDGASAAKAAEAPEVQRPAASRLGDLSSFSAIARSAALQAANGNLPGARTRLQLLQIAWDEAAAGIKPRAPDDWQRLEHSIDLARTALRGKPPQRARSQRALAQLLQTFNSLRGAA